MRRALVIGLGGTGCKVVGNIQDRIAWRYGSYDSAKFVQYLAVDTSRDSALPDEGVFYHATVSQDELRSMVETPREYSRILLESWADLGLLNTKDVIADGTGGLRMLGRLALLNPRNFQAIRSSLRGKIELLRDLDPLQASLLLNLPPRPDNTAAVIDLPTKLFIYVVATLAAGTGSGMFIDVGYLVHHIARSFVGTEYDIVGVFLLPPTHTEDRQKLANAYGSLLELDYFCTTGNRYTVRYPDSEESVQVTDRPFRFPYLVSAGLPGQDYDSMVKIIGQYIYTDVFLEATRERDGRRDDVANFFTTPDRFGYYQPYMTFGLSSIEFPAQQLVQGCTYRLIKDALTEWTRAKTVAPPDVARVAEGMGLPRVRDRLEAPAELQQGVTLDIRAEIQDRVRSAVARYDADSSALEAEDFNIRYAFGEVARAGPSQSPFEWGVFQDVVNHNLERVRREVAQQLTKTVHELMFEKSLLLESEVGVACGPAYTADLLTQLRSRLLDAIGAIDVDASVMRYNASRTECEDIAAELELLKADPVLSVPVPLRPLVMPFHLGRYRAVACAGFEALLEARALKAEKKVYEHLVGLLDRLVNRIANIHGYFAGPCVKYFDARLEEVARAVDVNGLLLVEAPSLQQGSFDREYERLTKTPEFASAMNDVIRSLGRETALLPAADQPSFFDDEHKVRLFQYEHERLLVNAAKGRFEFVRATDVIDRFMLQSANPAQQLSEVFGKSNCFLPLHLGAPGYSDDVRKSKRWIMHHCAKEATLPPLRAHFQDLMTKAVIGLRSDELETLDDKYMIVFLQERGAFPVRIIAGLEEKMQPMVTLTRGSEGFLFDTCLSRKDLFLTPVGIQARQKLEGAEEVLMVSLGLGFLKQVATSEGARFDVADEGGPTTWMDRKDSVSGDLKQAQIELYYNETLVESLTLKIRAFREGRGDEVLVSRLIESGDELARGGLVPDMEPEAFLEMYRPVINRYISRDPALKSAKRAVTVLRRE